MRSDALAGCGPHRAALVFEGEIRFGPEYFRLSVDGRAVPHRIFGRPLQWSADSRFLAVQEWLTTDYGSGPITCAALIDPAGWKIARLAVHPKGFAAEFRFDGGLFRYRATFPARSAVREAAVELAALRSWEDIDAAPQPPADASPSSLANPQETP
ncbi:hypothetical protein M4R22_13060 [Acidovorax sp. GBBC 3334]|uniref:hypothetical protein n=1 Tax=Acidovorax sp. GBBC 3334 TaxID=2940496 RepID=UPI0023033D33|nr:hypothetical protein [Acidovorax sp. GBBC 3334]MDA8455695.1 hypothetical protein [Acidovorax sp. GBBC 3334]